MQRYLRSDIVTIGGCAVGQKGCAMNIYDSIFHKLGLKKSEQPRSTGGSIKATPTRPAAVPVVDVISKLEDLSASNPGLDWKVSIVDLLKLLGIDSSFAARKELAGELNCPENLMADSASMNTWLHKTVLQKIAENGGNIPKSLLD
jgi:hypothetical protein